MKQRSVTQTAITLSSAEAELGRVVKGAAEGGEVIEEKTKGNLTEEESKILTDTLAQLRMLFVQVSG